MPDLQIAHVVRDFGGVTEPFIDQRLRASRPAGELWFERRSGQAPIRSRRVRVGALRAGGPGDRLFHRLPYMGYLSARAYTAVERESRPDVIHAHYLTTGFLMAISTTAPLVVSAYGFDASIIPRRRTWKRPLRSLARHASAVLVEGPAMRSRVIALGFSAAQVHIVPIAAGLDIIEYRDPPNPDGPYRLLMAGRMVEKKGHIVALRAFADLVSENGGRQYSLRVVGGGPLRNSLARTASSLGVQSLMQFLGPMSRADYLQELRAADLLLVPSLTARNGDSEGGAPTTILDAQASGVPVVGSDHADIPYLIRDGHTGFLFSEGSVREMARAIRKAIDEQPRWQAITREARRQVEQRHSDAAVGRLLAQIHASVSS